MNFKKKITFLRSLLRSIKEYIPIRESIIKAFLLPKKNITKELYQAATSTQKNTTFDEELIKRIKGSFLNNESVVSGHWVDMYKIGDLQDLIIQLKEKDDHFFYNVISNPHKSNIHYGFGEINNYDLSNYKVYDFYMNQTIYDCIYRISCYLGIEKAPETYHNLKFKYPSADQMLDNIFSHLKLKTDFPDIFKKEKGIKTKYGIISYTSIQQLYHALRVYESTKHIEQPKVLEIGAGIGMSAYHAWNFGIKDYTILDLNLGCVSNGFFLANTIGKNNIIFDEESKNFDQNSLEYKNKIKIIPSTNTNLVQDQLDLVLNCDSITEMSIDQAKKYVNLSSEKSKVFLSLNHDCNTFTINEIFKNTSFERVSRMPTWYRHGYIEEIYINKKFNLKD